jgi:peptidoglycan/xylan/chitin deacetylase (PgdA/CDA1 family)
LDAIKWPNSAQCAVMLTFDFDAETLWISRNPENIKRPGILSQGKYGANVGVPKILEVLREFDLKATFFVPGWTAEKHTDEVESILKDSHEVGHHGYLHEWITPDKPEEELASFDKGLEALKRTVGVNPKGYRSPAGETSPNMIRIMTDHGFLYDSSMMDHVNPYRHQLDDGRLGPVELPWHWSTDDAPYVLFSIERPRAIFSNEQIKMVWQDEFREIYKWGGLFDLVMHPQCTGRPARLSLLREMITFIQSFPGVWIATGSEVAQAWLDQLETSS